MAEPKTYDAILPIGMTCATATQLQRRNLRMASFPFDWLLFPKIGGLELVAALIETKFENFFEKEDLSIDLTRCMAGRYRVVNQRNGVEFLHDFFADTLTDTEYTKNKDKYRRRIDRFYETISQSSSTCLVLSMDCCESVRERIEDAYARIRKVFPNGTIDLFAVIFEDEINKLEEIQLNGGTLYLNRIMRQQNLYDIQERMWEFAWLDRVCLSDKFKTKFADRSHGVQARKMSFWERIHYKIYRHMHKRLERYGILHIRYDN